MLGTGAAALWTMIALLAGAASAADDAVARATRLYETHHYGEAARLLGDDVSRLEPSSRATGYLTLGMIHLDNADLHRELHDKAIAVQLDYLRRLAAVREAGGSRFVGLYLGKTLLESGNPADARAHLERFRGQAGLGGRDRAIADAHLGLCDFLRKEVPAARARWAAIDTADPEVQAALAAVYSRAGLRDPDPVAMADAALKKVGRRPSAGVLRSALAVYARAGLTDKSLALVQQLDLQAPSHTETLARTKTLNFYEVATLGDLAMVYRQASVRYLEKAAADARVKPTADYYLGAAYADAGNVEMSLQALGAFLAVPAAPAQYRERARVRYAAGQYRQGRRSEALAAWEALAQRQPADPDVLAEILHGCARARAQCTSIEPWAVRAADAGETKKTRALNIALGQQHLARRDYARAVAYLEAGRDKSNKNRIEANDPALLVDLAEAYYRSRQFSEALEIYFEMSKHFPAVRPIQEALQGIYSMEHKSAGDVKIL